MPATNGEIRKAAAGETVIVVVVIGELLLCFLLAGMIAVGNADGEQGMLPLWMVLPCAVPQLVIHNASPDPRDRRRLALVLAAMLLISLIPVRMPGAPY